jgi:hypothetical protein
MWERQPAVLQRRTHPLARFFDFRVGEPHQREAGQTVGQMDFNRDRRRIETIERTAVDNRE